MSNAKILSRKYEKKARVHLVLWSADWENEGRPNQEATLLSEISKRGKSKITYLGEPP